MKIQELENELNISRANIRFYEKEGLLNPKRKENGYRDYSNDDIAVLKKIIVYRKLGISVTDIKKIFNNELELQEAVSQSIENLQKEIERLNGSIELCKEIQKDNINNNSFDEEYYWEEINNDEAKGSKFVDICKDYMEFEKLVFHYISKYFLLIDYEKVKKKHGIWWLAFLVLAVCTMRGIAGMVLRNETFWYGFLYPFMLFAIASIIVLPIFMLKDKHPKIASIYLTILFFAAVLFIAAVVLLLLFMIIKSIFNF